MSFCINKTSKKSFIDYAIQALIAATELVQYVFVVVRCWLFTKASCDGNTSVSHMT